MASVLPSQLAQVFIDAVEAKAVPSKAHAGDTFKGVIGPLPMQVRDRMFGVGMSASQRAHLNGCEEEHRVQVSLSFVYIATSDQATYKRIIDDMALVSEALDDLRTSGVTNADAVLQVQIEEGAQIERIDEATWLVDRICTVVYNYG